MCVTHANIGLLITKLKLANIIAEKSSHDLCKSLSCENSVLKDECLERTCNLCKDKEIIPKGDFVK